jgi:hypothetical protein
MIYFTIDIDIDDRAILIINITIFITRIVDAVNDITLAISGLF